MILVKHVDSIFGSLLPIRLSTFKLVSIFLGEGSSFLSFKKGDLIVLEQENGEAVMNSGWCYGECVRSGRKGDFPAECVYVLPTITKPPPDILVSIHSFFPLFLYQLITFLIFFLLI